MQQSSINQQHIARTGGEATAAVFYFLEQANNNREITHEKIRINQQQFGALLFFAGYEYVWLSSTHILISIENVTAIVTINTPAALFLGETQACEQACDVISVTDAPRANFLGFVLDEVGSITKSEYETIMLFAKNATGARAEERGNEIVLTFGDKQYVIPKLTYGTTLSEFIAKVGQVTAANGDRVLEPVNPAYAQYDFFVVSEGRDGSYGRIRYRANQQECPIERVQPLVHETL